MKRVQETKTDALIVRISNRRTNVLPSAVVLETYLKHAQEHDGKFLYGSPYHFNIQHLRNTGNFYLYSNVSGDAVAAKLWDADEDYDPEEWKDEEYTIPRPFANRPYKTWIACYDAHMEHLDAHQWRLQRPDKDGYKQNLAVSFRTGTLSPYLFVEPDGSGQPRSL